eukprot:CAMPEP_0205828474 /NCGR_PEP_ID=MMETSP0206-20130828/35255_1 /ASSEMBLY_ACC=CAM_ASM_000279 /TAXON_ID=36767 /ORGANISM="Euplotes focardii, Strain TN1" /LENGTH=98 /DNA_ID=CAMNT_0053130335 /DNA_START=33 /DNA_END=326 /DNA_ORIENTATION=+
MAGVADKMANLSVSKPKSAIKAAFDGLPIGTDEEWLAQTDHVARRIAKEKPAQRLEFMKTFLKEVMGELTLEDLSQIKRATSLASKKREKEERLNKKG